MEDPFSCSMAQQPTQDNPHIVYVIVCQKDDKLHIRTSLGACLPAPWHNTGDVAFILVCMPLKDREQEIDGWIDDHISLQVCDHDVSYHGNILLWHGFAALPYRIGPTPPFTWHAAARCKKKRLQTSIGLAEQGLVECRAYISVLQLVNEVLAMFRATKLPQGQATHDWYKHKANAEVLQGKGKRYLTIIRIRIGII